MKKQIKHNIRHIQHGDVILTRLDTLPKGGVAIPPRNGKLVLAEGEHTGHAHTIDVAETETDAELIQLGERMLLKLEARATLTHQEHKSIVLEPGVYEVGRVREYDYFQHMSRPVQD